MSNVEEIYRQVTLPGPGGPDGASRETNQDGHGWSPRRTIATVLVLLGVVASVFWWALPRETERAQWWEPEGQRALGQQIAAKPIDLETTNRALDVLDRWERMSWPQKQEATRVIGQVFDLGGTNYTTYVEVNRGMIQEYLKLKKQGELARRGATEGQATTD